MQEILDYIKSNWKNTFRDPKTLRGDIKIDKPFISPSMAGIYQDLYYWDTYFINLGLMIDGYTEQAENNLDNIKTFIDTLGFMPNANHILDRSQPPLFTRGVYDLYIKKNDKKIIEKYMPAMLVEYDFFEKNRKSYYGLNSYSTNGTEQDILDNYNSIHRRVLEESDIKEKQLVIGKDIMAIAESGYDFNMRFRTKESKIDAHKFIHLDLNCILYDVEIKLSKMLKILDREKESEEFVKRANTRKDLINKYLFDKESGMYLDYNVVDKTFSKIISIVSLYPYTFGVSTDQISCKKVLEKLEFEHGISATAYRGEDVYFQWDYPLMWPGSTCLSYIALKNAKLNEDAKRIAKKYLNTLDSVFIKTHRLWEKYNAVTGDMGTSFEYKTPEMMGWTAAAYVYFTDDLKK